MHYTTHRLLLDVFVLENPSSSLVSARGGCFSVGAARFLLFFVAGFLAIDSIFSSVSDYEIGKKKKSYSQGAIAKKI